MLPRVPTTHEAPHRPACSLLTLLDDIASVLDDVAVMTKFAAKKTSGILGDDLALNAQQVTGVAAGGVVVAIVTGVKRAMKRAAKHPTSWALRLVTPASAPVPATIGPCRSRCAR